MQGNAITSEVVFFHRKSRTVIFTDLNSTISRLLVFGLARRHGEMGPDAWLRAISPQNFAQPLPIAVRRGPLSSASSHGLLKKC